MCFKHVHSGTSVIGAFDQDRLVGQDSRSNIEETPSVYMKDDHILVFAFIYNLPVYVAMAVDSPCRRLWFCFVM